MDISRIKLPPVPNKGGDSPRVFFFLLRHWYKRFCFFGAGTWVMTPCIDQDLGGFQNKVA